MVRGRGVPDRKFLFRQIKPGQIKIFCFGRIIAGIFLLFTSDKTYRDISEKYQINFSLYLNYAFLRNTNDIVTNLFLSDNLKMETFMKKQEVTCCQKPKNFCFCIIIRKNVCELKCFVICF